MKMTKQQALNLEAKLTIDQAVMRHQGTIKITDIDSNVTETEMLYCTADVLRLLDHGHNIQSIVSILGEKRTTDVPAW